MTFTEFKELKSKSKRVKYLLDKWKIERDVLIGTVKSKHGHHLWINRINSSDGERDIKNPFNENSDMDVYCLIDSKSEEFEVGDNVIFSFEINKADDKLNKYPIVTNSKNVRKLLEVDIDKLKSREYFLELLKHKNIDSNIHKVLVESDFENILKVNENKLKQFEDEIFKSKVDLEVIKSKVEDKNKELEELNKNVEKFERYGFKINKSITDKSSVGKIINDKKEQIEYIRNYLATRKKKPLFYSKEIIEQFYAGLCTNQLIVLSGQPGTGKTSLVEGFCDAIEANLKIISVQPNWTDNQDLLGFYNPIENTYISTPFLDAIIEAKENPHKLYIMCLDEMNLAHVEYYFSEFLSKLQSEKKNITLYSDYIYNQALQEIVEKIRLLTGRVKESDSEIDDLINLLKEINIDEYYKLKKQYNSICRYPSQLVISNNIRFVGTINKDETTKNLSPKVIDRSYIMEILPYTKEIFEDAININKDISYEERLYIKVEEFEEKDGVIPEDISERLEILKEKLEKVGVMSGNRQRQQIVELCGSGVINYSDIYDVIIATKILPKINIEIGYEDEHVINNIESELKDTEFSRNIFTQMKEYYDENGILTFWR